ncbi:hypothetical protein BH20ACT2_BH20ACT2_15110 [soil metagenome]
MRRFSSFCVVACLVATVTAATLATTVSPAAAVTATVANSGHIAIPAPGATSGVAAPYPSSIDVTGRTGVITDVRVTIPRLVHGHPDDLEVMLVSPANKGVVLMSDVGGSPDVADVSLRFADGGPPPTDDGPLVSGTFTPRNVDAADSFPAPPGDPRPAPAVGTLMGTFDGDSPNGTWQLRIVDDAGSDVGAMPEGWRITIVTGVANHGPIAVPDNANATPYPSDIAIAGRTGTVSDVTVSIPMFFHPFSDDLDILLRGPGGQTALLMSDAGGNQPTNFASLEFDDAGAPLPDGPPLPTGSFAPTNHVGNDAGNDAFPGPAPPGPYGATLSVFDGTDPNGTWSLFVRDDNANHAGSLPGGWSIDIVTSDAPPPPVPVVAACQNAPEDGYTDVAADYVHEANIDCITAYGLAEGFTDNTYRPSQPVGRAQMASFVARLLEAAGVALPANPPDAFGDDNGSVHELRINQLAAVGVIGGNGEAGGSYSPSTAMRRDHMASFLNNAIDAMVGAPLPAGPDAFTDDNGNPFEDDINRLAAAAVVLGTGGTNYSPAGSVSRGQMASFFARFIQILVDRGAMAPV